MGRWNTPFGVWVRAYGAHRLGYALGLSGRTPVYQWVRGATYPHPTHALRMVAMAGGRVSLSDIYAQRAAVSGSPGDRR